MKKHTGPSASEQTLFKLWDAIESARLRQGEKAAQQLATKALRAIQPEKNEDEATTKTERV